MDQIDFDKVGMEPHFVQEESKASRSSDLDKSLDIRDLEFHINRQTITSKIRNTVIVEDHIGSQIQETVMITPECENISEQLFKEIVVEKKQFQNNKAQIWIPKAIGIISMKPFYDFFSKILIDLYFTMFYDQNYMDTKNQTFLLEQFVKQLVDGFPPYTPGLKIHYKLNSKFL
jgi:hypothetical protein